MTADVATVVADMRAETDQRIAALRIERDQLAKDLAKRGVIEIPIVRVIK